MRKGLCSHVEYGLKKKMTSYINIRKQFVITMMQEDLLYPKSFGQDLFWEGVHMLSENIINRWPLNKFVRQRALRTTMELVHYHDETTHYITGACVAKVLYIHKLN